MMHVNCSHSIDGGLAPTEVKPVKVTATRGWPEFEFMGV